MSWDDVLPKMMENIHSLLDTSKELALNHLAGDSQTYENKGIQSHHTLPQCEVYVSIIHRGAVFFCLRLEDGSGYRKNAHPSHVVVNYICNKQTTCGGFDCELISNYKLT